MTAAPKNRKPMGIVIIPPSPTSTSSFKDEAVNPDNSTSSDFLKYEAKESMIPKPTESEKNICPAAAIQTSPLSSEDQSGFHIIPSPTLILSNINTLPSIKSQHISRIGTENLAKFSIPLAIPKETKAKLSPKQINVNNSILLLNEAPIS